MEAQDIFNVVWHRVAIPCFMPGADRVQILETAWKIERK
jgi:hypothetical protein